jgi:hypothetical protein
MPRKAALSPPQNRGKKRNKKKTATTALQMRQKPKRTVRTRRLGTSSTGSKVDLYSKDEGKDPNRNGWRHAGGSSFVLGAQPASLSRKAPNKEPKGRVKAAKKQRMKLLLVLCSLRVH